MSLSPLKVFQRFKELFARRSPSIAAAIHKAENRRPAAAYEPPVTKVIGPGGKVYTRDFDALAQDKDEDGVRTQARDTGKSGLEGLLFARSYPWVKGVGANGTIAYEYIHGNGFHYWNNGLPGYQASARLTFPDGSVKIYLPQDCPQNRGKDLV